MRPADKATAEEQFPMLPQPRKKETPPAAARHGGLILIVFAWTAEAVNVTAGVFNAAYTTFGTDLPTTFVGWIPALPMVVLAVAELGRVPLASVVYSRHTFMQTVAILGILALGYLAVENWAFGFERIVDLRLMPVTAAGGELARAERELAVLKEQSERKTITGGAKRDELNRGIKQREAGIAELTARKGDAAKVHDANLVNIREACRIIPREIKCMLPRSQAEDKRYELEVNRLDDALARQTEEKRQLQSQIDRLVAIDASDVAELGPKIATAEGIVNDAKNAFRRAVESNQIYRLAGSFYRVSVDKVTDAQFATARWVFSIFSAVAVAFAGGIAALVYYARTRAPARPSAITRLWLKRVNARRKMFPVYRDGKERVQVPGPTVYVPVSVPVPGIWTLLFERWFGNRDARQAEAAASGDNVRSFTKGK